jgi:GTP-binding protein
MTAIVAIVGRPNVGKSTLFNRLSRSRSSLVDDEPGVTRDRLYASVQWNKKGFTLIDTGGYADLDDEPLIDGIKSQVMDAVREADKILFVVDGREGLMPGDEGIYSLLRRSEKEVLLAVNKVDGPEHEYLCHDFYELGVEKTYPLSAAHGYGLSHLMEDLVFDLPAPEPSSGVGEDLRVAVLGRPNAGKSSLINRLLGFERLLVSELPGTTRDSVDILIQRQNKKYLFIDTAGLRRKAKVKRKIEKFSMIKSLKSLDRCHLAVIVLDAAAGVTEQDTRICGYAYERSRGLILAVNKWDLIKANTKARKRLSEAIERQFHFLSFAPLIRLSALTGEKVTRLFGKIDLVYDQFCSRLNTGLVNRVIEEIVMKKPPPVIGRTRLKIYYTTQTGIRPPTFVTFVNRPDQIHFSYKRFLVNQIRQRFGLNHTPIRLIFRKRT